MQIQRVEVSGFKRLSSLTFEPGRVNVLTGRNNAGKTSLLEAIQLALDPTALDQYGEHVDSLVNVDADEAAVRLEYDRASGSGSREVRLTHQQDQDPTLLRRALVAGIQLLRESRELGDVSQDDEFVENYVETAVDVVNERFDEYVERVGTQTFDRIDLSIDGQSHTFAGTSRLQLLVTEVTELFSEEIVSRVDGGVGPQERDAVTLRVRDFLTHTVGYGIFLDGDPEPLHESTHYEEPVKLDHETVARDQNDAAVRLSELEDYLREHDLVENLHTLSLDQMVYEEDDEKYQVPYEFTGEGLKTLLGLLWELSGDTDDLLLLEEPENHMHPHYVHQFVRWLVDVVRDQDLQVFLTTHDVDTIRSFFDHVTPEQASFLAEAFRLLKVAPELPESYDYDAAETLSTDLQLDPRGI